MTSAAALVVQLAQEKALVTAEQVAAARAHCADAGDSESGVLAALAEAGHLDASTALQLLSRELAIPVVNLADVRPAAEALALVPAGLAKRHRVLPLALNGASLQVAVADPLDDGLDAIAHVAERLLDPVLAAPEAIATAIAAYYDGNDGARQDLLGELPQAAAAGAAVEPAEAEAGGATDAPVIRLVQQIVADAVRRRASDIHLEPLSDRLRIRYRVDGVLQEAESPPKHRQAVILSRLKLLANMSLAERRAPQDGRIQLSVAGRALDLRASCVPTVHGESLVLRLLEKERLRLGLPELGLAAEDQALLASLITRPDGLVLVTGPTGSGKTTTLYACLHALNRADRKIITVEDPVEYRLAGINQVPVREDVGLTFAAALRAMLRQAPNVVMVGEIRDRETAEIAIHAALTGHLVFSTLHTNDAPGAVTRLLDIGVKPFLVAAALRAVVAQRLVRMVCPACRQPRPPPPDYGQVLGLSSADLTGATLMRGAGCAECAGTGYRGRRGIFEIFLVNEAIQRLIYDNVTATKLRDTARLNGMRTMREDGIAKVLAGLTTLDEIASATIGDLG